MASKLKIDLTGLRFDRWEVLGRAESVKEQTMWHCRCDCGNNGIVKTQTLCKQQSRSCGCLRIELAKVRMRKFMTKHGQSRTRIYKIWTQMRQRCSNPRATGYEKYGGRGIAVCKEWEESFEVFVEDMGPRPTTRHSLDRKENNGNYEPGNVRWATSQEQLNNRRTNHLITLDGQTKTCAEWAKERNLSPRTLSNRILRDKWEPSRALNERPQIHLKRKRGI